MPYRSRMATSAVAVSLAAMPMPGAHFMAQDDRTAGDGWHVEMMVGMKDPRFLDHLMLGSDRCDAMVESMHVRIRADGTIASGKPFDGGNWRLDARWTDADHVTGSFQITTPTCDSGVRTFTAAAEMEAGHVMYGTPAGSKPDLMMGSARARAQVTRLWRGSRSAARRRFSSYSRALALGYRPWPQKRGWKPPMLFHVRKAAYERDGRQMDPQRPESLVYWWPRKGAPILVAFMYRSPASRGWPAFGKPLLGWHAHMGMHGKLGATIMTHVWMTDDVTSGLANCMPTKALAAAHGRYRFSKPTHSLTMDSKPC
jgi:hypothetical protein